MIRAAGTSENVDDNIDEIEDQDLAPRATTYH